MVEGIEAEEAMARRGVLNTKNGAEENVCEQKKKSNEKICAL